MAKLQCHVDSMARRQAAQGSDHAATEVKFAPLLNRNKELGSQAQDSLPTYTCRKKPVQPEADTS